MSDVKVKINDHQLQQAAGLNESSMSKDQVANLVNNLKGQGHKVHARVDESTKEVTIKKYLTD